MLMRNKTCRNLDGIESIKEPIHLSLSDQGYDLLASRMNSLDSV